MAELPLNPTAMINAPNALAELDTALAALRPDARTAVADLVLLGLALDVQAQGKAALTLTGALDPESAMSNARVAFEAAQQAVVLATHPDYALVGIRAWVYFARKDRDLGATARSPSEADLVYSGQVASMRHVAEDLAAGAGAHFDMAEFALAEAPRKPDNWLAADMAELYESGLTTILTVLGKAAPPNILKTERGVFKALCRGGHARPRLQLKGIAKRKDGSLFADTRSPDFLFLSQLVNLAVAGAAFDAMLALCYRIARAA